MILLRQYFHCLEECQVQVQPTTAATQSQSTTVLTLTGVFYFYFNEILTDSTLATHRIGEQKFSCLQFASSTHNMASEVMETFCVFVQIQY